MQKTQCQLPDRAQTHHCGLPLMGMHVSDGADAVEWREGFSGHATSDPLRYSETFQPSPIDVASNT